MKQDYEKEIEEYKQKLKKLEKNSKLPEEQLQTIYKKAYLELRKHIKQKTVDIMKIFAFGYCKQSERNIINEFLLTEPAKEILDNRLRGLLRMPDYDLVVCAALELKIRYEEFKEQINGKN